MSLCRSLLCLLYQCQLSVFWVRAAVRQDRAAVNLPDDGRIDPTEFAVIHQVPGLPRAADGNGLDGGLLRVGRCEYDVQRHAVGPDERLGEIELLQRRDGRRTDDGLCPVSRFSISRSSGASSVVSAWANLCTWSSLPMI